VKISIASLQVQHSTISSIFIDRAHPEFTFAICASSLFIKNVERQRIPTKGVKMGDG
jgi:hypothetical protein